MIAADGKIRGPNLFGILVDNIGMPRARELLEVSDRTISNWRDGITPVPRMAVLALFWESQYGRSVIDTDQVNEIRLLYRRVHLLEAQYAKARTIVAGLRRLHTDTANEAYFDELKACDGVMPGTYGTSAESLPEGLDDESIALVKVAAGQSR